MRKRQFLILTISGVAGIINLSDSVNMIEVVCVVCINIVSCVIFFVLTFGQNLGKKVSKVI